jgi:hypothetical protein
MSAEAWIDLAILVLLIVWMSLDRFQIYFRKEKS